MKNKILNKILMIFKSIWIILLLILFSTIFFSIFNINPNNKLHRSKVKSLRGKLNSCRAIEPNIFSNIHNQLSKIEKKLAKYKCN